jgi:hypothetical protein
LLSAQRAVTVALYLVQDQKLSPCKVSAAGRGKYYPVNRDSASSLNGMAQDRRIELEIWPVIMGDSAQIRNERGCVDGRPASPNGITPSAGVAASTDTAG